jgi:anion-transporting  ArsA/GET3 family ATPase
MLWPSARLGRLSMGVARVGAAAFAGAAGRLVGARTLADTAEFLREFDGMYAGFKERAARVMDRMSAPDCAFLVVTAPTTPSLGEAAYFLERLSRKGMRPAALVANRWNGPQAPLPRGIGRAIEALAGGNGQARAVASVLADAARRQPRLLSEARAMNEFAVENRTVGIVHVPDLPGDIHDVAGLRRVAKELFADGLDG